MMINRNYKDRLFRMVFHEKESLLELYNAVHGTSYEDTADLEITTIQDAIYMSMKNDVSFLVGDVLNLYEHQSTLNPNMPVRGFLYLADVYRKYIKEKVLNIYGKRLLRLPLPVYLVFYNGLEEESDRTELYLSDCFENVSGMEGCLECKAILLNINLGHNRKLMEECKRLRDYAQLVYQVRRFQAQVINLETAVDAAVSYCIAHGIMAEWLSGHRAEVMNVLLTEYDEQEHMRMEREDAKQEGRIEGIAEGKIEGKIEGKAEYILELLGDLGDVPPNLCKLIHAQTDINLLSIWHRAAARSKSVAEFQGAVGLKD